MRNIYVINHFKHATCVAPMFLATIVKYCAKIDFSVEKQRNT